jgi:hypothetical protein
MLDMIFKKNYNSSPSQVIFLIIHSAGIVQCISQFRMT